MHGRVEFATAYIPYPHTELLELRAEGGESSRGKCHALPERKSRSNVAGVSPR